MYLITDCISGKTAEPVGVLILSCIAKFGPSHFTCLPRGEMGERLIDKRVYFENVTDRHWPVVPSVP